MDVTQEVRDVLVSRRSRITPEKAGLPAWGGNTARMDADPVGRRYDQDADAPIVGSAQRIAEARGVAMAQGDLAWVLRQPAVSAPIVGPTETHHLSDAVAALEVQLTEHEVDELEEHCASAHPALLPMAKRPT